ncbi:phage tail terminator family protein [Aminipila terrae]|uniref:Uncharacterized protein n=1 Tax=Aminipila terrae TaxID=2697030 RepID=A0A6P1MS05_9FIRM|nr:hypothetical protein [Aminipila terrae]QHI73785.1 hypothetical protein Ami3637_16585 [Aminipila terrae]
MITYGEIHEAIVNKVRGHFPKIKIQASDNEKGLVRPSFRVTFDSVSSSNFMNTAQDRSIPVRILFFPSDREKYRLEILDIQWQLVDLFLIGNITTKSGFIIETHECESETVDGVLHFTFDLELYEDLIITDDRELMGDIELQENVNK